MVNLYLIYWSRSLISLLYTRHGYARWQAIVEDKDLGLAEVGRQELSLPVISGPSAGGVQMGDSASNSFTVSLVIDNSKAMSLARLN